MKEVVCVGHIGGRVGSSMVMGLLELSGYDVGNIGTASSPQNAKGFFEIKEFDQFLRDAFPFMDKFMPFPSQWGRVETQISVGKPLFNEFISDWFTGDRIALKCPYYFPALLFDDSWTVRLIGLDRIREHQVASIREMNNKDGHFATWINNWENMVFPKIPMPNLLMFEDWINDPVETYRKLFFAFAPPNYLSEEQIKEWVDPKLVHYK